MHPAGHQDRQPTHTQCHNMCQIKCRIGENLCHGGDQPKKDIYITSGCCFLVIFPRHLDPIWPSMLRGKKGGRRCSANSLGPSWWRFWLCNTFWFGASGKWSTRFGLWVLIGILAIHDYGNEGNTMVMGRSMYRTYLISGYPIYEKMWVPPDESDRIPFTSSKYVIYIYYVYGI